MAIQGAIPVEFGHAFPRGAYATGGFEPVRDFEASKNGRFTQSKDKTTGLPLSQVDIIDADPPGKGQDSPHQDRGDRPARPAVRPGRVTVRAGGVHRPDGHPLCQPGRAARVLAAGHRHPGPGTSGPVIE